MPISLVGISFGQLSECTHVYIFLPQLFTFTKVKLFYFYESK